MNKWIVLVNNGYDYEYEDIIEAPTAMAARKIWKQRGDYKTVNFKVTRLSVDTAVNCGMYTTAVN